MCDITTALMIGSTVMGGVGQVQAANAQAASSEYSAKVAEMNATIADRAAKDALERGADEERKQRTQTSQLMGQQRANMAANGVDLSFGSPLDLMVDTAKMGELDALTIRRNTAREERDIRQQASNYRTEASMSRSAASGALSGGYLGAVGTVLGGGAKAYGQGKTAGIWG